MINVANPVFELITLLSRKTKVKVIGICHGHKEFKEIVEELKLNPEEVEAEMIGFNHVIWLTRLRYRGEDGYKLIDEWMKTKPRNTGRNGGGQLRTRSISSYLRQP